MLVKTIRRAGMAEAMAVVRTPSLGTGYHGPSTRYWPKGLSKTSSPVFGHSSRAASTRPKPQTVQAHLLLLGQPCYW